MPFKAMHCCVAAASYLADPLASDGDSEDGPPPERAVLAEGVAAADGALPDVLYASFPGAYATMSAVRRVIREGCITVDGAVGACGTQVRAGQALVRLEKLASSRAIRRLTRRPVFLQLVYEDAHLAVVTKPYGIKVYGDDPSRTVVGNLAAIVAPSPERDALPRPQPVHRLDAAVGGLLLCAKTAAAAAALGEALAGRAITKQYLALLCGRLEPGQAGAAPLGACWQPPAVLAAPLSDTAGLAGGSSGGDALPPAPLGQQQDSAATPGDAGPYDQYEFSAPVDGKESVSRLAVVSVSRSSRWGGWLTTAALWPATGRRHQLRQHMAALGCPIVGDGIYRGDATEHVGRQGIYLEAVGLTFDHPVTGQTLDIQVPEPRRFVTMRDQQASAWAKAQRRAAYEEAERRAGAEQQAAATGGPAAACA